MTESLETTEDMAQPFTPASKPAGETLVERARFAVNHPDVLHTPAMYREIIRDFLVERGQL
jgi:hypothetical protein